MLKNLITTILIASAIGPNNSVNAENTYWNIFEQDNFYNVPLGTDGNGNYYQKTNINYDSRDVNGEDYQPITTIVGNTYSTTQLSYSLGDDEYDINNYYSLTILQINSNIDVLTNRIKLTFGTSVTLDDTEYLNTKLLVVKDETNALQNYIGLTQFTQTNLENIMALATTLAVETSQSYTLTGTSFTNKTVNHLLNQQWWTEDFNYLVIETTTLASGQIVTNPQDPTNFVQEKGPYPLSAIDIYYYKPSYVVPVEQEVIDVGGLLFQILAMPFAFISQAFNLTLFPNTPYAVNIGGLILGILGVAVMIMVLTIILKYIK